MGSRSKSNKDRWSQHELEKFTVDYFEQKALKSSTKPFLEELFNKGILLDLGDEICFKFDCFRSFFLAQKIADSNEFKDFALSRTGFLRLSTEIDYFTGLHRNREDFLKQSIIIVEDFRKSLSFELDLKLFEKIGVENSILSIAHKESIQKNLFGKKPTIQEQEKIFDDIENEAPKLTPPSTGRRSDNGESKEGLRQKAPLIDYFEVLQVASMILRNSELVNDAELKHEIYRKLLTMWSEVLLSVLLTVEKVEQLQEEELSDLFPGVDRLASTYLAKLMLPNIIFSMLKESIGTSKLQVIIEDHISLPTEQTDKLLSTFLYVDLALPEYLIYLKKLLNNSSSTRYVVELIFFKLLAIFLFKNTSDSETRLVEELVGDVFVRLNDSGSKFLNDANKSNFITQLQKKELKGRIKSKKRR